MMPRKRHFNEAENSIITFTYLSGCKCNIDTAIRSLSAVTPDRIETSGIFVLNLPWSLKVAISCMLNYFSFS